MTPLLFSGGCSCGRIRYIVRLPADQPMPKLVICHCTNCKRNSGSSFSCNLVLPATALEFVAGEPKVFFDSTDEGPRKPRRQFCGDCGTPFTSEPAQPSGIISLKWGTLDNRQPLAVIGQQVYCRSEDGFLQELGCEAEGRFQGKMDWKILGSLTRIKH
ncbi:hypothetical protein BDV12DRAFT_203521 [Aspergillus spectabilis]